MKSAGRVLDINFDIADDGQGFQFMAGYAAGDSILPLEAEIRREVSANGKTSATTSEEMLPVCQPEPSTAKSRVQVASISWPDQAGAAGSFGEGGRLS
jgi:hypothetical protein